MQSYKGLGEAMKKLPLVQSIMNSKHFCAFCILEKHIQNLLSVKEAAILPLAIILLIGKIGGGNKFHIGQQSDAQEFLYNLLEDLAKASFGYLKGVPFSYEKQTLIPRLFQGKLETITTCGHCKQRSQKVDDFCNLNLVSSSINNPLVEPCGTLWQTYLFRAKGEFCRQLEDVLLDRHS
jgi:uncharacterized UBP type Zn finger protein